MHRGIINQPNFLLSVALIMSPVLFGAAVGCSADGDSSEPDATSAPGDASITDLSETGPGVSEDARGDEGVTTPEEPALRCAYLNPFSQGAECKSYLGADWTAETAQLDCDDADGILETDGRCGYDDELGRCMIGEEGVATQLVFPGADPSSCEITAVGCEVFGGGVFTPAPICEDATVTPPPPGSPFIQPFLDCRDPISGEEAGDGPDGQVCTWVAISGCTEQGRKFEDYASCDVVRTQRPYYGFDAQVDTDENDPRLSDGDYLADAAWVKSEVEAAACVCCHGDGAPSGASGWTIDAGPLWLDTVPDSGLAMMAGLADSRVFGAYPPADNNGFSRDTTGVPTTDVDRMADILVAEYVRRGFTVEQGLAVPPFGGPLYTQLIYEPEACEPSVGADADGNIVWPGGPTRYLYVLNAEAVSPGVPPNLDVPEGTRWFIGVDHTEEGMDSPIAYGAVNGAAVQRVPETGEPAPLISGESYYLVALRDIGIPLTRCIFVAP
ncbi:MAG: hypothetical protein ACI9OJ_003770 [Myxococcota bacterium]|jgi:hypothetical protein